MSKEWKRVVVALVVIAGCALLVVIIFQLEATNSTARSEKVGAETTRIDSAAIARDSIQRAETDRRMREYMKQHPPSVRDKY